jgi:ATP-GRASP peptide maturase of grasp-with-spasm system
MDWLEHFGTRHLRLSAHDLDQDVALTLTLNAEQDALRMQDASLSFSPEEVKAIWYRGWQELPHDTMDALFLPGREAPEALAQQIRHHRFEEHQQLSGFLFTSCFGHAAWLGHPRNAPNKLRILQQAAHVGLPTPATLVTNRKEHVQQFATQHGPLITKAIGRTVEFRLDGQSFVLFTAEMSAADIERLPDRFFPSLFQEKVEKVYEVRVFYLDGACWSMAIFSQSDPQTRVDFRRYNDARPNRHVPYRLPSDIEDAIGHLMRSLAMDTGSIDLIRTPDGRHVFLEVNPSGQFGWLSQYCNYHLECQVAAYLTRKDRHATA